jgi:PAS domain S-box-containing protein
MLESKEKYKIIVMAILLADACIVTYYFHAVLNTGTIFTHYFYIPIILAALWWRRKGLVVAIFLALLIIFSHLFVREEVVAANDYFRVLMFIVIAFVTATLGERIAKAQEKSDHLNAILGAIRNVNQLIAREKDRDRLIQKACENLIETRGYYSAWIALVDESHRFLTAAEAGLGESFSQVVEMMKRGEFTRCGQNALKQSSIIIVKDVAADCADCPLVSTYSGRAGMAIRLEHRDRIYGILSVSIPAEMAVDADEQSLFNEVAGDIALALRDMKLEEARKRAEEALRELNDELEERVKRRTAELVIANEQLKQEITERERAEEEVKRSHEFLAMIIDNIPDTVTIKDPQHRLVLVNQAYCNTIGNTKDEIIGKTAYREKDKEVFQTGNGLDISEQTYTDLEGKRHYISVKKAPLTDESGKPTHVLTISRDITERKQAEDKVKEAYRLREHFLKETSHRIITPVAIIGGNTDLLLESSNLDDDQKEKIRSIRERNEEVQKLVRDALAGKYLKEEEEEEGEGGEG